MKQSKYGPFLNVLNKKQFYLFHSLLLFIILILFLPNVKDYLIFASIDTLLTILLFVIESRLFAMTFKEIEPMLSILTSTNDANFNDQFYQQAKRYPFNRTIFLGAVLLVKFSLTLVLLIYYLQDTPGHSHSVAAFVMIALMLVILISNEVFYIILKYISKYLRQHKRSTNSSLLSTSHPYQKILLNYSPLYISLTLSVLITINIFSNKSFSSIQFYVCTLLVNLILIATISKILMIQKNIKESESEFIQSQFQHLLSNNASNEFLPIIKTPLISELSTLYDNILFRIQSYEQEVSFWHLKKTEKTRHNVLADISSLLVHDLSSSTHVIAYCLEALTTKNTELSENKFIEKAIKNNNRSADLIKSIRSYIREPMNEEVTNITDCMKNVEQIVNLEIISENGKTEIEIPEESELSSPIPKYQLQHIFYTILKVLLNVSEDFISPIQISMQQQLNQVGPVCKIEFRNSSFIMTPDEFETKTSLSHLFNEHSDQIKQMMDLRLTKRLVEKHGGKLQISGSEDAYNKFLLEIPTTEC